MVLRKMTIIDKPDIFDDIQDIYSVDRLTFKLGKGDHHSLIILEGRTGNVLYYGRFVGVLEESQYISRRATRSLELLTKIQFYVDLIPTFSGIIYKYWI